MNARVDRLLDEVLGLPQAERSALAVALIDSLESESADVSPLWRDEVLNRRAALRAGNLTTSPWLEVRARLGAL